MAPGFWQDRPSQMGWLALQEQREARLCMAWPQPTSMCVPSSLQAPTHHEPRQGWRG